MSDRVAVILGGELRQIASPSVLYRDPDDLDVALFVGTPRINVLPATATSNGLDVFGAKITAGSFSGSARKNWPLENFRRLAHELERSFPVRWCAGPETFMFKSPPQLRPEDSIQGVLVKTL